MLSMHSNQQRFSNAKTNNPIFRSHHETMCVVIIEINIKYILELKFV